MESGGCSGEPEWGVLEDAGWAWGWGPWQSDGTVKLFVSTVVLAQHGPSNRSGKQSEVSVRRVKGIMLAFQSHWTNTRNLERGCHRARAAITLLYTLNKFEKSLCRCKKNRGGRTVIYRLELMWCLCLIKWKAGWKDSGYIVKKMAERVCDISVIFFLSKFEQPPCEILVSHLGHIRKIVRW